MSNKLAYNWIRKLPEHTKDGHIYFVKNKEKEISCYIGSSHSNFPLKVIPAFSADSTPIDDYLIEYDKTKHSRLVLLKFKNAWPNEIIFVKLNDTTAECHIKLRGEQKRFTIAEYAEKTHKAHRLLCGEFFV